MYPGLKIIIIDICCFRKDNAFSSSCFEHVIFNDEYLHVSFLQFGESLREFIKIISDFLNLCISMYLG